MASNSMTLQNNFSLTCVVNYLKGVFHKTTAKQEQIVSM